MCQPREGSGDDFDANEYCEGLDNGEYPYPDNCRKYVDCFDDTGVV